MRPVEHFRLLQGTYGRLRDVRQGPDGSLYVLTSNRDGRGAPRSGDDRVLAIGSRR
jgi:glucose/arabinose dehydrogenase